MFKAFQGLARIAWRFYTTQHGTWGGNTWTKGWAMADFGIFGATDTTTGKVSWKIQVDQPAKSGMLVAGDLAFFGEGNGKFHSVDARTGEILVTFDGTTVPNGGGAQAAPVAYVVNGKEYILNAFGGNLPDRVNFPPNPVGVAVIAFSLP